MPRIEMDQLGIGFDMHGCPNRCRHCWLGSAGNATLSEADVRWGVAQFRRYIHQECSSIQKLSVATSFREPDYRDDYRYLYDLELELSDGPPDRYELLSIWRLARDENYAAWAKSVGPDTCQISFFGLQKTNDWFYRRKGAFEDALTATQHLLKVGMKPRWQIFLTRELLPELDALLNLTDRYQLRERVRDLGGAFQIFLYLPGPDHEGRKIENLRPLACEVADLPETILASTRQHLQTKTLWQTEKTWIQEILSSDKPRNDEIRIPETLWFFICSNWDVYSNVGTLEPWWRLGNLKKDSVKSIFSRFENNDIPGLQVLYHDCAHDLATRYGDPEGQKIYSSREDLLSLYRAKHCENSNR